MIILLMQLTSFIGLSIIIEEIIVDSDKMKNIPRTVMAHVPNFRNIVVSLEETLDTGKKTGIEMQILIKYLIVLTHPF